MGKGTFTLENKEFLTPIEKDDRLTMFYPEIRYCFLHNILQAIIEW